MPAARVAATVLRVVALSIAFVSIMLAQLAGAICAAADWCHDPRAGG